MLASIIVLYVIICALSGVVIWQRKVMIDRIEASMLSVEEAKKRVNAVSNALPRTHREGGKGYIVR